MKYIIGSIITFAVIVLGIAWLGVGAIGCGPTGRRVAFGIADCTIQAAYNSATDIIGHLDSPQPEWNQYVAISAATKAGETLLRCGLSHLLTELDNKIASNSDSMQAYLRCHGVKEHHRLRIVETLAKFK